MDQVGFTCLPERVTPIARTNFVTVLIVFYKCQLSLLFTDDFTLETQFYLIKPTIWLLFYICSAEKDAFNLPCATAFMKTGQTRLLAVFGIIHRFWATCRKLLDKNRLDFKASRLRIRQSNRKREIETRSHLSR